MLHIKILSHIIMHGTFNSKNGYMTKSFRLSRIKMHGKLFLKISVKKERRELNYRMSKLYKTGSTDRPSASICIIIHYYNQANMSYNNTHNDNKNKPMGTVNQKSTRQWSDTLRGGGTFSDNFITNCQKTKKIINRRSVMKMLHIASISSRFWR